MDWQPLLEQVQAKLAEASPDSRRLFHGRGGSVAGLEFVCVDSFFPALLVTLFTESEAEQELCEQLWQLSEPCGYLGVAVQRRYLPRAPVDWCCGQPLAEPVARRGNLQFPLDFSRQNVGFFLDIEPGRHWLEQQIKSRSAESAELKLLNLFAYTCAFSAVARAAGQVSVVNIDMNRGVLKRGQENHLRNGQPLKNLQFLALDALREFKRFDRNGPFQLAVVDPPTRQKGSFDADKDYMRLLRMLPACLAQEADLLLCLNSPRHSETFFRELIETADSRYAVVERLAQNPDFPDRDVDAALKMLHVKFTR
jgi:23S rRNA (cytosine1962-C5)-methyltransferase